MSSKKINTSISFSEELLKRLDEDRFRVNRSRSNCVETLLREHYGMPQTEEPETKHGV